MKVFMKNPKVEYLGKAEYDPDIHLIEFTLDMNMGSKDCGTVKRGVILEVDAKELWSIGIGCSIPHKRVSVKIKEPDDLEVVND